MTPPARVHTVINTLLQASGWKGIVKTASATRILAMGEKYSVAVHKEDSGVEHIGIVEGMSGLIQLLETTESADEEVVKYEIYKRNA